MKKYPIGIMISCNKDTDLEREIKKAQELELDSCQICIWDVNCFVSDEYTEYVSGVLKKTGFPVTGLWAGWSGPCEWNFTAGPATIGLVPEAYRAHRIRELMTASDFAKKVGIPAVITHAGFIPENPDHPDFNGTVAALRYLAKYMQKNGQLFLFETGQETPVTMLRTIQAIGCDNVGINFDTANLILYGKANSVDAIETFGQYVRDTHIKDGFYPTDGMKLGKQAAVGEGRANVAEVIKKLDEFGYTGSFTIEREITGEQQIKDIIKARDLILKIYEEN